VIVVTNYNTNYLSDKYLKHGNDRQEPIENQTRHKNVKRVKSDNLYYYFNSYWREK